MKPFVFSCSLLFLRAIATGVSLDPVDECLRTMRVNNFGPPVGVLNDCSPNSTRQLDGSDSTCDIVVDGFYLFCMFQGILESRHARSTLCNSR